MYNHNQQEVSLAAVSTLNPQRSLGKRNLPVISFLSLHHNRYLSAVFPEFYLSLKKEYWHYKVP